MRVTLALFNVLLAACPREMRAEYGDAMRQDFTAAVRAGGAPAALHAYADVLAGGLAERAATVWRDVAFTLRGMRRTPLFSLVIILTTAIAIGANGAIYGLMSTILLRPLPIANASELVALWEVDPIRGYTDEAFTFDDFAAVRRDDRTLGTVAALSPTGGTLVGAGGPPRALRGAAVSDDFFALYSARPEVGRLLGAGDARAGARTVVISDQLWRTRFDAGPSIVGRTVRIDDTPLTVVGVAPPRFFFADLWRGQVDYADYFVPLDETRHGISHSLLVVARPVASRAAVDADLQRTFATLRLTYPGTDAGLSARTLRITDAILGPMRPSFILMGLAVLAVLAVACANVANLFLSRGSARAAEIATRFALGATRRRLAMQLLTESTLHIVAGGAIGLAIAAALARTITGLIDAAAPVLFLRHLQADWGTFASTAGVIVVASVLAGAAPAIALSRPDLVGTMKGGDRAGTGAGRALRGALITLEVALAIAVVAAAAITTRSYLAMTTRPLGFETRDVSVAYTLGASPKRYATAARAERFYAAVRSRVLATPGITSAAWATTTPFVGEAQAPFTVAGAAYAPNSQPYGDFDDVSPGFFATLRAPLLAGRDFTAGDRPGAPQVAIVNASFARRYLGGIGAAIGKRITIAASAVDVPEQPRTVVGVAGDMRQRYGVEMQPTMYAPIAQLPPAGWVKMVVRSRLSAAEVASTTTDAIAAVDATIPPATSTSLDFERTTDAFDRRLTGQMLAALALVALGLAVAGIYAVVSYAVARRTREIGVRVAFGASPRSIAVMVLRDAVRLAATGIVLGCALAGLVAWQLKAALDVDAPVDVVTALTVLGIIAAAIVVAAWLPARRAARLSPVIALRYE
ncbi:MAG TPA: ADOP family duplicated permease [Candidatus Elarobacter sp.]|nr:ADOP family duplicated permease [Candidatus Elarobacter sp.]